MSAEPVRWTLFQRLLAKNLNRLAHRSGVRWYHRGAVYNEAVAAWKWLKKSGQIFHFIYGENSYRYLGEMKRTAVRNAVIATYHTPPSKFRQLIPNHRFLKQLDAVVIVSNSQREIFDSLILPERVFFVPHGIDVDYFRPEGRTLEPEGRDRAFQCLFVGTHLRDFQTLSEAARVIADRDPSVLFCGVIPEAFHGFFKGIENVTLMTRISDERLLQLYQQADLLVLPLIDGTANNSILEAMACGLPIVSTDMQATRDYVEPECALLGPKGDVRAVVEAIEALKCDSGKRKSFGEASRRRAMAFSWERVSSQMKAVYRVVMEVVQ
ncbi:glycosyltransferase family 4 protein [Desulfococcus sp.]|uniref:glycosyltransferase family 4 protein n=1 Tax=Desulfococcus sp. TaxID=2025834 RepID=UPI003593999A